MVIFASEMWQGFEEAEHAFVVAFGLDDAYNSARLPSLADKMLDL